MAYIFIVIFISKLVSVEMAWLLGIQNKIQAACPYMLEQAKNLHYGINVILKQN